MKELSFSTTIWSNFYAVWFSERLSPRQIPETSIEPRIFRIRTPATVFVNMRGELSSPMSEVRGFQFSPHTPHLSGK